MNRQFEELAGKANFGHIEKHDDAIKFDPRLEAFAKLIVEKCAEMCVKNEYFNEHSVASDYATKASVSFKKHFGME
jgi:hypothetical protein